MRNQTVRIAAADHDLLAEMAKASGRPMAAVLSEAIQSLNRRQLLEETNAAYGRLKQDPRQWQDEDAERLLWDSTLADGLD